MKPLRDILKSITSSNCSSCSGQSCWNSREQSKMTSLHNGKGTQSRGKYTERMRSHNTTACLGDICVVPGERYSCLLQYNITKFHAEKQWKALTPRHSAPGGKVSCISLKPLLPHPSSGSAGPWQVPFCTTRHFSIPGVTETLT